MAKKKIMVVGDKSLSSTGFSVYNKKLLEHFHNNDKYEVAEFANAGHILEKKAVPWKYYPAMSTPSDSDFKQAKNTKLGQHRWARAALHFRPNVVICLQDPWDYRFLNFCELRKFYDYCMCVPIDGKQQKAQDIENCHRADSLITYTKFGKSVLNSRGVEVDDVIPMGIDLDSWGSKNKYDCRRDLKLPINSYIYGFVARNQPRKRLPELFRAFKKVLTETKRDDLFLYLHTTYPDVMCWDIPSLLLEFGLAKKVYFSYKCVKTNKIFAGLYQEPVRLSPFTNEFTGRLCGQQVYASREELNKIYSSMDLYIQCACNEGLGYPVLEAAGANVNVAGINHTAMTEVISDVGGELIYVDSLNRDYMMNMDRASIPIDATIECMLNFDRAEQNTRENLINSGYGWDLQVQKWEKQIEKIGNKDKWTSFKPKSITNISGNVLPRQFVSSMSGDRGYSELNDIKDLYYGAYPEVRAGTNSKALQAKYSNREKGEKQLEKMLEIDIEEEEWMM